MEIRAIAPDLSVSVQLEPDDVGRAASAGFRSIVINRPDGEGSKQPSSAEITAAAVRHGLQVRYLPVVPGRIDASDVDEFAAAMRELPAPILAYCRTGTRSASLWALAQAGHLSTDAILKTTAAAGYDLGGLRARLESEHAHRSVNVAPPV